MGPEHTVLDISNPYVRPVIGLTYAAAYLGIASGAFEIAMVEMPRMYRSGARRIDNAMNQRRMAALMLAAASSYDEDRSTSFLPYLQAKVTCSEAAVRVTQDLMTAFGGTAFASRLPFERYFRDARAGLVMGMANDVAYQNMIPLMFPEI